MFSCKFCEISKNSFSYRTPLVAASGVKTRVSYEIMTMKRQLKIFRAKWRALLWVLWTVPVEILRRIQRFRKGAVLCVEHHGWPISRKTLGFRWSKKAKITLKTISYWQNISINIFKFSPFLYANGKLTNEILSIFLKFANALIRKEKKHLCRSQWEKKNW